MNTNIKPLTIFGLGYAGLPLSLCYCMKGYKVYGIDISEKLVNDLKAGITHHMENYRGLSIKQILKDNIQSGNFIPSTAILDTFESSDKYIVTVGIPVNNHKFDFKPLKNACLAISGNLKKGDTVIIRSTVTPGTTEEKLIPILERPDFKAGKDFYLVYCPERISEGNAFDEFENMPVIISGINEESLKTGIKIIKMISMVDPIPVSKIKLAETAKLMENIQRDVNIAMVHQFADICGKLDISVFELIKAVNTHLRVKLLQPGPGVGGYCIPNALYYLKPSTVEAGVNIDLLNLSRKINAGIPEKVANRVKSCIAAEGKEVSKSKAAVLGIAMKDYCSDDRQSPVVSIINNLVNSGISVMAFDNCVSTEYPFKTNSVNKCLDNADCLLIAALQPGIDYNDFNLFKILMKKNPLIFDTRNIINKTEAGQYGFKVISLQ